MENQKKLAIELRKSGKSHKEIHEILGMPKSTLRGWLNGIKLTEEQKNELDNRNVINGQRRGRFVAGEWAKKRLELYNSYEPPLDDNFFIFGLTMYWAEGTKNNDLRLTNSDERILILFVKWILKYFGQVSFIGYVYHHYPERDEEIKQYWKSKIQIDGFYPSQIVTDSTKWKKNIHINGILSLSVKCKNKWMIKEKIKKSIDKLTEKYGLIIGI